MDVYLGVLGVLFCLHLEHFPHTGLLSPAVIERFVFSLVRSCSVDIQDINGRPAYIFEVK